MAPEVYIPSPEISRPGPNGSFARSARTLLLEGIQGPRDLSPWMNRWPSQGHEGMGKREDAVRAYLHGKIYFGRRRKSGGIRKLGPGGRDEMGFIFDLGGVRRD